MMRGEDPAACDYEPATPTLFDDLRAHFERSGFAVESTGDADLDVRRPDAPSAEQEAREIELHLQVWRLMHPGIRAELVDR